MYFAIRYFQILEYKGYYLTYLAILFTKLHFFKWRNNYKLKKVDFGGETTFLAGAKRVI